MEARENIHYPSLYEMAVAMASILDVLHHHGHFIPHLVLNGIIAVKGEKEKIRIKIDYKRSRFIGPLLDRPSLTLKKLLSSHPDIVNQRPLNFRSDLWYFSGSLGWNPDPDNVI